MDLDEYAESCLLKELIVNALECDLNDYWYEFHADDNDKKLKDINLNYSLSKLNQLITINWEICSTIKKLLINFYPLDQQIDIQKLFKSLNDSLKNLEYLELINFKNESAVSTESTRSTDKKNLIILELTAPLIKSLYLSNNDFNLRIKSPNLHTLFIDYLFSKIKFEDTNQLKYLELNDYHRNAFYYKNLQMIKLNNVISVNDDKNPANEIRNLVDLQKLKFIYLDQIPYSKDEHHTKLLDVMTGHIQRLLDERSIAIKENDLKVYFKTTELIGRKSFNDYPIDQILGNEIDNNFIHDDILNISLDNRVNENIEFNDKQIQEENNKQIENNDQKDNKELVDTKEVINEDSNENPNIIEGDEIIDCVYYECGEDSPALVESFNIPEDNIVYLQLHNQIDENISNKMEVSINNGTLDDNSTNTDNNLMDNKLTKVNSTTEDLMEDKQLDNQIDENISNKMQVSINDGTLDDNDSTNVDNNSTNANNFMNNKSTKDQLINKTDGDKLNNENSIGNEDANKKSMQDHNEQTLEKEFIDLKDQGKTKNKDLNYDQIKNEDLNHDQIKGVDLNYEQIKNEDLNQESIKQLNKDKLVAANENQLSMKIQNTDQIENKILDTEKDSINEHKIEQ